jgi:hypothetical protein
MISAHMDAAEAGSMVVWAAWSDPKPENHAVELDALISSVRQIVLAAYTGPLVGFILLLFAIWNRSRLEQGTCIRR